MLSREDKV
jgi:hypothetical protein